MGGEFEGRGYTRDRSKTKNDAGAERGDDVCRYFLQHDKAMSAYR